MTPAIQEETYSVSTLCEEVRELLRHAYPEVWVAGEVNRIRLHRSGHFYFELVEKGEDDQITSKLEAVAWRNDYQAIRRVLTAAGQEIAEGQTIRCRGSVDFYPPFGRIQLVVREVDPVFTLGLLAQRRRETLTALAAAGLLDRNRSLPLSAVPLEIGLVTSQGSAAYHDFLSSLTESGYGFRVHFVHAAVQGREAERQIVSALEWLARLTIDCVVLIRGGGSRADLAVFDSRRVAEAITRSPVPVLTGLGHEIDESIADRVAHSAFKTPTKVAESIVERVAGSERALEELAGSLGRRSLDLIQRRRRALERCERELGLARHLIAGAGRELRHRADRLRVAAETLLRGQRRQLRELPRRLVRAAPMSIGGGRRRARRAVERLGSRTEIRLQEWAIKLSEWQRFCVQLAPERTLQRGFAIARDDSGRALTGPEGIEPGDRLSIQLARGQVASRVEEV